MAEPQKPPEIAAAAIADGAKTNDESPVHLEKQEAYAADQSEHSITVRQAFKVYYKAVLWSATVSMALVMESYVLQVMAAFNAQPAFQRTFGVEVSPGKYQLEAQWQAALANASKVGIMLGLFVCSPLSIFLLFFL